MRSAIRRYTDQIGSLWTHLADYYVRSGLFERVLETAPFVTFLDYVPKNMTNLNFVHFRLVIFTKKESEVSQRFEISPKFLTHMPNSKKFHLQN